MTGPSFANASVHNVAETAPPSWTDGGRALHRVPRSVTADLNVGARERYRHPSGCELRFVPTDPEGAVSVELSAAAETVVRPFWGPFQGLEECRIGPDPTVCRVAMPDRLRSLPSDVDTGPFAPSVCRLRFEVDQPVAVHDVSGPARAPTDGEVPGTRVIAYGTSITEGFDASAWHLCYLARLSRALGVDPLCLAAAGSAYCEPAMAEYLAAREDWDAALLSVSVNMANRGFTVDAFRERAQGLIERVTDAHPAKPVFAVTLYPHHADLGIDGDAERAAAFRQALREAVADVDHDALHLLEGPDVLDVGGLTADLLHPGDDGHARIATGLAARLADRLE